MINNNNITFFTKNVFFLDGKAGLGIMDIMRPHVLQDPSKMQAASARKRTQHKLLAFS